MPIWSASLTRYSLGIILKFAGVRENRGAVAVQMPVEQDAFQALMEHPFQPALAVLLRGTPDFPRHSVQQIETWSLVAFRQTELLDYAKRLFK